MPHHINLLELEEATLSRLSTSTEPISDEHGVSYQLERKEMVSAVRGFYTTEIVIRTVADVPQYFKFLEIAYLDNQITYTKPFEVFKSEKPSINISYSNYMKDDDEF